MASQPTLTLPRGTAMPLIGLGTWPLRGAEAERVVLTALESGYRHIDTATMYENEADVGRALRSSGVSRGGVFITTKVPPEAVGRERETLAASLEALGTDHVDLWLIHWPPDGQAKPEAWERLLEARDEGLAKEVGVSNYSIAQIDELIAATGEVPAVNQIPWAPPLFDGALLTESRGRGVVVEGYSPFKHSDLGDPVLQDLAARHGVTTAQVVVRWHVQHEVPAIPKSATAERIAANIDVFGFKLSDDEMQRIDGLSR